MNSKPMSDEEVVCKLCGEPILKAPQTPSYWLHRSWAQRSKCGHYAEPLNPQPPTGEGVEGEFEAILIKRAGEYTDQAREHRNNECYAAANCCEDKASGLFVAVKLFRIWNAAKGIK